MLNVCNGDKSNAGIFGYFSKNNSGNGSYYEAYRASSLMLKMPLVANNKLYTTVPSIPSVKKSQLSYNPISCISKNRFFDDKISNNCSSDYGRFVKVIIEIRNFIKSKLGLFYTQFYQ